MSSRLTRVSNLFNLSQELTRINLDLNSTTLFWWQANKRLPFLFFPFLHQSHPRAIRDVEVYLGVNFILILDSIR